MVSVPARVLLRSDEGVPDGVREEDDEEDDGGDGGNDEVDRDDLVTETLLITRRTLPFLGRLCDLSPGGVSYSWTEIPQVFIARFRRVPSHGLLLDRCQRTASQFITEHSARQYNTTLDTVPLSHCKMWV